MLINVKRDHISLEPTNCLACLSELRIGNFATYSLMETLVPSFSQSSLAENVDSQAEVKPEGSTETAASVFLRMQYSSEDNSESKISSAPAKMNIREYNMLESM